MKKLHVGLAGFGPGGHVFNAPIIGSTEGFIIAAAMTSNPQNIKVAREKYPQASIVADYDQLLKNEQLDLIVITTPNHTHYPMAKEALLAGKHVVVEKPFTVTTREAEDLIRLAKEKQVVLSINHNRRWDSDFQTVRQIIASKRLGKIVEFQAHFDRFRNYIKPGWKEQEDVPGSGILYDLGSHLIDQALLLFGLPSEVFALLSSQRADSKVTDNFEVFLIYPDLKVRLSAGMLVKHPGPRYTVLGRNGSFLKFGMDPQEAALKEGQYPRDMSFWGVEDSQIWGELHLDSDGKTSIEKIRSEPGDYRKFYQNIYQAIVNKAPLEVTPEQARRVIQIIEASYRSHQTKRMVAVNE